MISSPPLCAVGCAQDHDGLLELDEAEASKAFAISLRAAMDPTDSYLWQSVPDRTGPVTRSSFETRMRFPVRRCASIADAEVGDTLSGPLA